MKVLQEDFFVMGQWKARLETNLSEIRRIYGSISHEAP